VTTPRCHSCRHWQTDLEDRWAFDGTGYEWSNGVALDLEEYKPLDPQPIAMRTCKGVPFYIEAPQDAIAVVKDGSGYSGRLVTRADFGCVLHEEAP
jgi:hypothetical protein